MPVSIHTHMDTQTHSIAHRLGRGLLFLWLALALLLGSEAKGGIRFGDRSLVEHARDDTFGNLLGRLRQIGKAANGLDAGFGFADNAFHGLGSNVGELEARAFHVRPSLGGVERYKFQLSNLDSKFGTFALGSVCGCKHQFAVTVAH